MITSAVERGSLILVYDELGNILFSEPRGSAANDGLVGFTGSAVTIRAGSVSYTYGPHGEVLFSKPT
jgi:hypothetical protein